MLDCFIVLLKADVISTCFLTSYHSSTYSAVHIENVMGIDYMHIENEMFSYMCYSGGVNHNLIVINIM